MQSVRLINPISHFDLFFILVYVDVMSNFFGSFDGKHLHMDGWRPFQMAAIKPAR